jgi:tetraacyldisaccharide 4'-kinase
MARAGERVSVPVICIGNLTVGGAGKTPSAIAVAKLLLAQGANPFFLSRGYGGTLAGPVRVGPPHRAADVGDEPLLLAKTAPTIVARDRVRGAAAAVTAGADVIVMDDGFQNPSLAKDLSLVVLDGERGIGNGLIFPAGPLRAPLEAQLARAGALLVLGEEGASARAVIAAAQARDLLILRGRLVPDPAAVAALAGRKVLAFAGIAYPEKFFATLSAAGITAAVTRGFPDHHAFTRAEADDLVKTAERNALSLVTTEKDLMRIEGVPDVAGLAEKAATLPVRLAVDDDEAIGALVREAIAPPLPR